MGNWRKLRDEMVETIRERNRKINAWRDAQIDKIAERELFALFNIATGKDSFGCTRMAWPTPREKRIRIISPFNRKEAGPPANLVEYRRQRYAKGLPIFEEDEIAEVA